MSMKTARLFTHAKRPAWGVGLLLQDNTEHWTLSFEDGEQRTLTRAHPLLEPKELGTTEAAAMLLKLTPKKAAAAKSPRPKAKKSSTTFAAQLAAFERKYPEGFSGAKYLREIESKERGEHRQNDSTIEDARVSLSSETLKPLLEAGDFEAVHRSAARLMGASRNLVVRFDITRFSRMSAAAFPRFARALEDVLHGTEDEEQRWDAYVRTLKLDRAPTWPMVTLLPALHRPEEHAYVRSSVYRRQAAVLGRPVPSDALPSGRGYLQFRDVAYRVRDGLVAGGQAPKDLWDVYRFVWLT
ncbi:MAG: hypothetical protein H5U40_14115, partial [Polyangiaceae bacterium]|nr:hypothetical protein [Polyangiaceae bacterium]